MRFVISATGPTGTYWLSEPNEKGLRSLARREDAGVFPTIAAADHAIAQMALSFANAGILFAVEAVREADSSQ
jgi:hypothetical protein